MIKIFCNIIHLGEGLGLRQQYRGSGSPDADNVIPYGDGVQFRMWTSSFPFLQQLIQRFSRVKVICTKLLEYFIGFGIYGVKHKMFVSSLKAYWTSRGCLLLKVMS